MAKSQTKKAQTLEAQQQSQHVGGDRDPLIGLTRDLTELGARLTDALAAVRAQVATLQSRITELERPKRAKKET